jgi:RNA polymerase sigma-70 factor (ECF subfamily)
MMLLDFWSSTSARLRAAGRTGRAEDSLSTTAERVFYAYAPRVYGVARRILANEADAEDVTQDVLLQVVRKLDTFRGESALATWLHRVTVNAALAHRRKQSRRRERQAEGLLDVLPAARPDPRPRESPDRRVLDREMQELIERAIARLPEMYRDVYVLADVEDLPNAEIGEMLGLSVPAVKSRLHRARLMMRESLASYL